MSAMFLSGEVPNPRQGFRNRLAARSDGFFIFAGSQPVAMIVGIANRDNVPLFFVQTWHPEPSRRRVISQHDTIAEASGSVLWDRSVVDQVAAQNAGAPNGTKPAQE